MIRIGVCDDIPFYVEKLFVVIESWARRRHLNIQLKKFRSGEEVLLDAEEFGEFAAVFLDIELSGINGVETAAKLRELDPYVSIIFSSQYDQYFRQMLEIHPCYFLEKPVAEEKVFEILDRIIDEHQSIYARYSFQYKRRTYQVSLGKVLYFTSDRRQIRIIMEDGGRYVFYEKLDELEQQISEYAVAFIRIHKSYLVNSRHIEQYHPTHVMLPGGEKLPISQDRRENISRFHMELLDEGM